MLEEHQAEAQKAQDLLEQAYHILEGLVRLLVEDYPEEDRTFRQGRAMETVGSVTSRVLQAATDLHAIEWPTVDRPR